MGQFTGWLLWLLLCALSGLAQTPPALTWQKALGGSSGDYAYAVTPAPDGGFVVAGYTSSYDKDVTGTHGGYDAWVVKLDASGNKIWQKALGGSDDDQVYAVTAAPDGGYVVAGSTNSTDGDVSGNHGSYDFWVVKLDASGNKVWQKTLGGSRFDEAHAITTTPDGGFVVAGSTASTDGDVTGMHGGTADMWVVKLDALGNKVWQKALGGGGVGSDQADGITRAPDGGFVVAGSTQSTNGDVTNNQGGYDFWVVKLDALGNKVWQKTLGGSSDEQAYAITTAPDGGFIAAGYTSSSDGDILVNQGSSDYWVIKLDASGNKVWQKTLGGRSDDRARGVTPAPDGGFVVAGFSLSGDGDVTNNLGEYDYWVVKLDASGNKVWQKNLGGRGRDQAYALTTAPTGGYVIAGITGSTSGDVSGQQGFYDYWVAKLGPEPPTLTELITSPDPVCAGQPVQFTSRLGNVSGNYSYTLTNGAGSYLSGTASSAAFSQTLTASGSGTQSFTLTVTTSGGMATGSANLTVIPTSPDYQPLADLYNATGGPNWPRKDNWLMGCTPCGWYGVTCDGNGRVTGLNLVFDNLRGTIPASLSALTSLQNLNLSANNLRGTIPASLSALTALQTLDLNTNQLDGSIPASLSTLTRLQTLNLGNNALSGGIPAGFGSLTALQSLNLFSNQLTGPLPASLGRLPQLQSLRLITNQLSGCFPASYTALCGKEVSFANNPGLPGGGDFGAFCANGTGSDAFAPVATASPNPAPTGSPVSLNVTAGSAYQWSGPAGFSATIQNPTLSTTTPANSGLYSVTVGNGSPTCSAVASVSLTVSPSSSFTATLSASPSTTLTCAQTSLTLTAGGGADGPGNVYAFSPNVASQRGNTAVVHAAGVYSVTVTSTPSGYTSTASITIYQDASAPTATLSALPSTTLTCSQSSLTLTAGGGSRYSFSSNVASQNGNAAIATTAGIYSVTVTSASGCSAVAQTTVTSEQRVPPASLSNDGPLSGGKTRVTLTATGGQTYAFSNGASQPGGPTSNTASVSTPGAYQVTVTSAQGCTATASTSVAMSTTAPTSPTSQTVCRSSGVVLSATTTGVRYEWYKNGQSAPFKLTEIASIQRGTTTASLTLVSIQTTASYYVKVFQANGESTPGSFVFDGPFVVTVNYGCTAPSARQAAFREDAPLRLLLMANPVDGEQLRAVVEGAGGQDLSVMLVNLKGQVVRQQRWSAADPAQVVEWLVGAHPAGVYILQARSGDQQVGTRLVKQ